VKLISIFLLLLSLCVLNAEEGAFRIENNNQAAITTDENALSQNTVTINIKNASELQYYQVAGKKPLPDTEQKQYYLDFEEAKNISPGTKLKFNSAYLSRELVSQLTLKLNPKNDEELISKMNKFSEEEWRQVLLGQEKSESSTDRPGLAELKRRYQDLDEHLGLMTNETYSNKPFEKNYFIPTGFIEVQVENNRTAFLKTSDLIQKKISIDVKSAKVSILKNVMLYFVQEISKKKLSKDEQKLLTKAMMMSSCSYSCLMKQEEALGSLLQKMIEIQNNISLTEGLKLKDLVDSAQEICHQKLESSENLPSENITQYFALTNDFPNLTIEQFFDLNKKISNKDLIPFALANTQSTIDDQFLSLAKEAIDLGLAPSGLKKFSVIKIMLNDKAKFSIRLYRSLLNQLNSDYILKNIVPRYKEMQNLFSELNITFEEYLHLSTRYGSHQNLMNNLKKKPLDVLKERNQRVAIFHIYPQK
jgi:hypothetical protein